MRRQPIAGRRRRRDVAAAACACWSSTTTPPTAASWTRCSPAGACDAVTCDSGARGARRARATRAARRAVRPGAARREHAGYGRLRCSPSRSGSDRTLAGATVIDADVGRAPRRRARAAASSASPRYLTKPVKQSDLLDAIHDVLGGAGSRPATRPQRPSPRRPPRAAAAHPAGRGQSSSIRSWSRRPAGEARATRSTVADNGREAVAAARTRAVRRGADGRADAGDGRLRGHRGDPRRRARDRRRTSRSSR